MSKWEMAKLGDICKLITDGSHNPPAGIEYSEFLMLSSKNINNGKISFDEPRYLQEDDFYSENKRTNIEAGDVLLTIVGTVGRAAVVTNEIRKFVLQRSVAVLKTKQNIIFSKYLMYSLISATSRLEQESRGVAQKGIYLKQIKDFKIPLPPLDIQKHIADTLDKIQEIIDYHKKQLAELDKLIKATFFDMFGDPIINEMEWETKKLSSISLLQSGGTPSREISKYFMGDIPWVTTVALNKLFIGYDDANEYITEEAVKNSATKIAPPNSILFGTRVGVGKVSINTVGMCTNQDIVAIINIDKRLNRTFFIETLKKFSGYYNTQKRGATIKGITSSVLKDTDIILPPTKVQGKFAQIVTNVEQQKTIVKQSITESQTLFNSLMNIYFD